MFLCGVGLMLFIVLIGIVVGIIFGLLIGVFCIILDFENLVVCFF